MMWSLKSGMLGLSSGLRMSGSLRGSSIPKSRLPIGGGLNIHVGLTCVEVSILKLVSKYESLSSP